MAAESEPIAIIGAGCRFPGASNRPSKLWELLRQPTEVASEVPADRFNVDTFYHPIGARGGSTNVKEGYFISDVNLRHFDAQFFSFPPAEADAIDPQHRHLLEVVYEALEDAGLTIEGLQGSNTSVFVGHMCNDYSVLTSRDFDHIPKYSAPGIAPSNASSRLSYFFDWHGPTLTIDTACSSSLIAVSQAVQALRAGTSDVAVAAGTNLVLDPLSFVSESNIGMLSPTGRSRMWDTDADGYARGDGVAAVILKKLSAAIRDGDPIDCIIREVGCNHDGRTQGITVPSGVAQAALIRETYAKAGLDPTLATERCQYFEAHGTGTPAGDPQEASALHSAFFGSGEHTQDDVLYVGSIKTVIGHTEGTAGLAGVLKACMAVKHGVIPPNLLLNKLSPAVEPYYKHLRIQQAATPWPKLPAGVPRRASVNSFGFGGSNAHAILEAYEVPKKSLPVAEKRLNAIDTDISLVPFVFSANSESSLTSMASSYLSYLRDNSVPLDSLKHTLSSKRSTLPCKITFSASSKDELISKIEQRLAQSKNSSDESSFGSRSLAKPSILGVFTGQGAQWPTMGSRLIAQHASARKLMGTLDESLQSLPVADRPQWKLLDELSKPKDVSRIGEAALSQPLCTAVQLVLVDLLRTAGVVFTAVVGHSSGEIAAAYAAGFISARDAIRIAYYRGLHAKSASGPGGCRGSMMAVGTSFADAQELVELEDLEGRLCVAASNSPSSVTLSGDEDAIQEAKDALDGENKFTRLLQVDTAYHSHHMLACAEGMTASLAACNIELQTPDESAPAWLSSVHENTRMVASEDLQAVYWAHNMTQTVLFSQALEHAVETCGQFNMAIEIGPHPALKRPALDTLKGAGIKSIEYTGTFARGKDDVQAVAECLGSTWERLGTGAVRWDAVLKDYCGFEGLAMPVLRDLPLYPWDHHREFWSESRTGKLFRTQQDTVHELLGKRLADGTSDEVRWKNVLSTKISPWLPGHALQGQTVFPATGYVGLAMEAAMEIAAGRPVQSIDLSDFDIHKAIAIDDNVDTEIIVTLSNITGLEPDSSAIRAHFICRSPVSRDTGRMGTNATGSLVIAIGEAVNDLLPQREQPGGELVDVDIDKYYDALKTLGYGYSGPFRGLSGLRRRLGFASGSIIRPPLEARPLLFHPGLLDTSVHSLFASFGVAGDGGWSLAVPSKIRRVTLIPSLCGANMPEQVEFDCAMTSGSRRGDIDIISADGVHKCIQIDGLEFVPFAPATAADDKVLFSKATWAIDRPDGDIAAARRATQEEKDKGAICERVAFYYLRNLTEVVSQEERDALKIPAHHESLFDFASFCVKQVRDGKLSYASRSWLKDTYEDMVALMEPYGRPDADFDIMCAVGEAMPAVVRGETTILEVMTRNNMLEQYYKHGLGCEAGNITVANYLEQITQRFPHMNVLEVGAGTGGATWEIMGRDVPFASYTYTDVSAGFFDKAQTKFRRTLDRMLFRVLDIERSPAEQGFTEHAYDMVVASHVLHATHSLEQTMTNVRSLLKPGGFVVILEIVEVDTMPIGLIMGGLPGWWVGKHEGRKYSPNITLPQWNRLLKKTGFAGVDTFTPMLDPRPFTASVFVGQAVDNRVSLLRRPLASRPDEISFDSLVLLGGDGMETTALVDELEDLLRPRCQRLVLAATVDDLEGQELPPMTAVLSLADLDSPVFKDMTESRWEGLKRLLGAASSLLWVTSGAWRDEPEAGTMVGLLRSVCYEHQHQRPQLLEVPNPRELSARLLAELIMRIQLGQQWRGSADGEDMLYTIEPELVLEDGSLKIMRQMPDQEANDRYNSARRSITKDIDLGSGNVELRWDGQTGYALREVKPVTEPDSHATRAVRVEHSTLCATRTASGLLYVSLGSDILNGTKVLALHNKNASTIQTPAAVTISLGTLSETEYLTLASAYLLSQHILARSLPGSTVLIHEPHPVLAAVLMTAEKQGQRVHFSTLRSDLTGVGWVQIRPSMPVRSMRRVIPAHVDVFFDLSQSVDEKAVGIAIAGALPEACQRESLSSLVSRESTAFTETNETAQLLRLADKFVASAHSTAIDVLRSSAPAISRALVDIPVGETVARPLVLVNWRHDAVVPAGLEPIDTPADIFRGDKTYWMVGLAGDLGQSLCDWMAAHGARNIVLSSRSSSTRVSQMWLDAHAARGVIIKLITSDVTDIESLERARAEIEATLPPIAGVANGALVLRDRLYLNTDFETFQTVMRPKTVGTVNLDTLFNTPGELDWFVAFSSIVGTVGNPGQSSYSAANLHVKAVVNARRARGLPGATIDIAPVLGVGYVERERKAAGVMTERMVDKLQGGAMPMSESDLHQLFAEAVAAGRPGSGRHGDIVTGVRTLKAEDMDKAFWAANLKFSHFIHDRGLGGSQGSGAGGKADTIAVKTQLLEAGSVEDAAKIIRAAFTSKLNSTLQHPADQKIPDELALIELGIDSLVAVEVRTWFLQELSVDMPMLKILGGSTIVDLVEDAIEKLPEDLLSKLQKGEPSTDKLPLPTEEQLEKKSNPEVVVTDEDDSDSSSSVEKALSSSTSSTELLPTPLTPPLETAAAGSKDGSEFSFVGVESFFEPDIIRTEPMSYGQTRFWFLKQYLSDPTTANITFYFRVAGAFQPDKLRTALELACARHEGLRTCFFARDEAVWQGVMSKSAISMEYRRVSGLAEVQAAFREVRAHVYDIGRGDTLRLVLCEESPSSFYFILGYDHIAMDGFSWEVLFAELQAHYRGASVPRVTRQYPEWAVKQRNDVTGASLASDRRFWRREFPSVQRVLPLLPMAKVGVRQQLKGYQVHRTSLKLDAGLTKLVRDASAASKVSPFHFHLTVFRTLLFRLTGESDLCIGMADAGRMDPADAGVIGLLLNLLPLHFASCSGAQPFGEALREVRTRVYAAMAHSRVPFNVMLDDLAVPRSTSHHPLFQAFIEYRPAQTLRFADLRGELPPDHTAFARTPYDIELNVLEDHGGEVTVSIGLQAQLYAEEAAPLVLRSYLALLKAFAVKPELKVQEPGVYAQEDIDAAIKLGRGELIPSAWPSTLLHRIDDMADAHADSIAVKDTLGKSLSYKAMTERVKAIQSALSEAGVEVGSRVAVFLQPSIDWVCCLLAVMRQGAIYVPLDSSQGMTRLNQVVTASSPAAVLIDASTARAAAAWRGLINIEDLPAAAGSFSIRAAADKPAVILFTSGTTGTPKGILLQHAALLNVVEGMVTKYDLGRETVLQQSAFSFDMSLEQAFLALSNGGTLVIADRSIRGNSQELMKAIAKHNITFTNATPPELSSWFRNGAAHVKGNKSWRYILAGGDRMAQTMRDELRGLNLPQIKLFNSYGPAEGTIIATKMVLPYAAGKTGDASTAIPIGHPLPNYSIYIVDDDMRLLPQGVSGEILIGGQGVALGYLGDAAQTAAKFIPNPWAGPQYTARGWTKLYRSGDRGHLSKDGALVFHGRIAGDSQIKLRGIRLELEDIESNILREARGNLSSAVCTLRGDSPDSNYLVAHVVFSGNLASPASSAEARSQFLTRLLEQLPLPQYMKPARLLPLDSLPLTKHGKIDRAAVATMIAVAEDTSEAGADASGPPSETEVRLGNVWRQLLPADALPALLSRSSDFFMLGGSSLLLVEVQSLVRTEFHIDVALQDLYEVTTLGTMAAKVQALVQAQSLDWDVETAPPTADEFIQLTGPAKPIRRTGLEIVMTGATGHLGRFVLDRLIADASVAKVHCVAVRDAARLLAHHAASPKVAVYAGDLGSAQLGLSDAAASQLASAADAVVHCGATRLNWETFTSVRAVNVTSTRELLRLASPRRLPVHFVSSGGVFPADVEPSEASSAAHVPPAVGADGYVASKWASERLLERAAAAAGVPVHVYRTVRADEGSFPEELPEHILAGMAKSTIDSMAMLDHGGHAWVGFFDLVSALDVADSIAGAVARPSVAVAQSGPAGGELAAAARFVNHKGKYRVWKGEQLDALVYRPEIQERMGRFKMVPPQIWLGQLKQHGFPWMMGASEAVYKDRVRNRR